MPETFHAGPNLGQLSDVTIIHGDCIEAMRELADDSVDAICTDPPYGLGFMGKEWDALPPGLPWAQECLRVLKPGGHLLAFGGTRTWHRLAVAVEDAGFEIRDSIAWLYGSGFPKSLNVSNAIKGGLEAPETPQSEQWQGWGTALKPAWEGMVTARKPLNLVPLGGEVDRLHHLLGSLIWLSLSPAKRVELGLQSRRVEPHEVMCVSALASAALNRSPDESDTTVTFNSLEAGSMSLSIATSWSSILDAFSGPTTMSTTSTASNMTTGLRILSSLLAPLTSRTTMPRCGCLSAGSRSSAPNAGGASIGEWANWLHTLSASVPETATYGIAQPVAVTLASIADGLSSDAARESSARTSATDSAGGSLEPVVVGRKPFKGNVAANVLAHGTGALNIDGCRVHADDVAGPRKRHGGGVVGAGSSYELPDSKGEQPPGRWPANVILDESQAAALDEQSGTLTSGANPTRRGPDKFRNAYGDFKGQEDCTPARGVDIGGASRFFKVAEADKEPRSEPVACGARVETAHPRVSQTCALPVLHEGNHSPEISETFRYCTKAPKKERPVSEDGTAHPTVKPLALMRWLVRLVTPPGGVVCTLCDNRKRENTTPTKAVRDVRDDVHAGQVGAEGAPILLEGVREPLVSGEPLDDKGLRYQREGVSASLQAGSPDGDEHGVHRGASSSDVRDAGSNADSGRSGSPSQRGQAGQPARESGSPVEADSRQNPEAAAEAYRMSPLWRDDQSFGTCATCGSGLSRQAGLILDPFAGSGTTVEAALQEGFQVIGIEREADYLPMIQQRIARCLNS